MAGKVRMRGHDLTAAECDGRKRLVQVEEEGLEGSEDLRG